jgi:hypothetical protein
MLRAAGAVNNDCPGVAWFGVDALLTVEKSEPVALGCTELLCCANVGPEVLFSVLKPLENMELLLPGAAAADEAELSPNDVAEGVDFNPSEEDDGEVVEVEFDDRPNLNPATKSSLSDCLLLASDELLVNAAGTPKTDFESAGFAVVELGELAAIVFAPHAGAAVVALPHAGADVVADPDPAPSAFCRPKRLLVKGAAVDFGSLATGEADPEAGVADLNKDVGVALPNPVGRVAFAVCPVRPVPPVADNEEEDKNDGWALENDDCGLAAVPNCGTVAPNAVESFAGAGAVAVAAELPKIALGALVGTGGWAAAVEAPGMALGALDGTGGCAAAVEAPGRALGALVGTGGCAAVEEAPGRALGALVGTGGCAATVEVPDRALGALEGTGGCAAAEEEAPGRALGALVGTGGWAAAVEAPGRALGALVGTGGCAAAEAEAPGKALGALVGTGGCAAVAEDAPGKALGAFVGTGGCAAETAELLGKALGAFEAIGGWAATAGELPGSEDGALDAIGGCTAAEGASKTLGALVATGG